MSFWLGLFRTLAASTGPSASSDVKIQIRSQGDFVWRDFGYVSGNAESVQNGVQLAASANPGADVRAIDQRGSIVDFA